MAFPVAVEIMGVKSENRSRTGFSASVEYRCAWEDRIALRDWLLVWPGHNYPYSPLIGASCVRVATLPAGRIGQTTYAGETIASFDKASLVAEYATPEARSEHSHPSYPSSSEDWIISEEFLPSVEMLTIPPDPFAWESDAKPLTPEEAPALQIHGFTYQWRRVRLTEAQVAALNVVPLLGTTNLYPVVSPLLGLTMPPETMLFTPPRISMETSSTGERRLTAEFNLLGRGYSWNRVYRPETGLVERIKIVGSSPTAYWQGYPPVSWASIGL